MKARTLGNILGGTMPQISVTQHIVTWLTAIGVTVRAES